MQKSDMHERFQAQWQRLQQTVQALEEARPEDLVLLRGMSMLAEAVNKLDILLIETKIKLWPEPTVEMPDLETLEEWMFEDGGCEASDGCWVEPDGICMHGHPSWLLRLGLI